MLFVMWFSGLRGAIAYALSLHLEFEKETRQVIITTTLIIILFTTLVFGGLTMPIVKVCMRIIFPVTILILNESWFKYIYLSLPLLLQYVQGDSKRTRLRSRRRRRSHKEISLSKTKEMVS
jgi:hypothetical protein